MPSVKNLAAYETKIAKKKINFLPVDARCYSVGPAVEQTTAAVVIVRPHLGDSTLQRPYKQANKECKVKQQSVSGWIAPRLSP